MHLLYGRFFTKALNDLGLVRDREPFLQLFNQGQILGADGERMSKSRGNVQDPDELVERYGADTVRLFLMFMGPWDQGGPWSPTGSTASTASCAASGRWSSTRTAARRATRMRARCRRASPTSDARAALRSAAHTTLRDVTEDHEGFRWNTMIAKLMELTNTLFRYRGTDVAGGPEWDEAIRLLLLMLAPIAPHITEELWSRRLAEAGEAWSSIHRERWPEVDPAAVVEATREIPVQVNGKLRDKVTVAVGRHAGRHRGGGPRARADRRASSTGGRRTGSSSPAAASWSTSSSGDLDVGGRGRFRPLPRHGRPGGR